MSESSSFMIESKEIGEKTKELAERELRETPENVAEGLKELRLLLAADSTIQYEMDDEFLIMFLRPCKFYAESAYDLMKRIADFRSKYASLFEDLLPEDEKETFLNYDLLNILVNRDQKGRRVLVCATGVNWNPAKVSTDQILRMLYLLHLAALLEPETQVRGIVVIMDLKELGMRQVRAFTPSFAKKLTSFIQEALPLRLKEFHMVNNPVVFKFAWQIVKPFINEKFGKRIHFHQKDMQSLHKFLEPDTLPEDYGGTRPRLDYTGKDWYPAVQDYIHFYRKWNSCGRKG